MKASITEEDILFCEALYHPRCFAESLFTNYDNLAYLEPGKMSHIRNGQIPFLSFEYLIANNKKLSEKSNFALKMGAGDSYVLGGRNFGKCEWEENKCLLASGKEVKFKDLIGKKRKVWSLNQETLKLETSEAFFSDNGIQDCIKIITSKGKEITVTENHPLLTQYGWKEVKDIKIKDFIATPRKYNISGKKDVNENVAKMLGYMIGDGSCKLGSGWTNINPELIKEFYETGEYFNCEPIPNGDRLHHHLRMKGGYGGKKRNPVKQLLTEYNLRCNSPVKTLHDQIFFWKKKYIKIFLNRYFACDGHINLSGKNHIVELCSTSKILLEQVQSLLLRFGIQSSIGYPRLFVTEDFDKFLNIISIKSKDKELRWNKKYTTTDTVPIEVIKLYLERKKDFYYKSMSVSKVKRKYGHKPEIKKIVESDIYWDFVVQIQKIPKLQTVAVEVPKNNTYISNNVISHNSVTLKIDMVESLVLNDEYPMGITSYDAVHIRSIIEPVINAFENHPIFSCFKRRITRSPTFRIETTNNAVLESINMNIAAKSPGNQFYGKHFKKLFAEEVSFETDEVFKKRVDSRHECGCIEKFSGMANFTKFTPTGRLFNDPTKRPWVLNLPQYVNPMWDDVEKMRAIKKHNGMECFDTETEILTDNGWKQYNTITKEDRVLSLNMENGYATYEGIKKIFIYDYDGYLYSYNNNRISFAITENHEVIKQSLKRKKLEKIPFKYFLDNKPIKDERVLGDKECCVNCGKKLEKTKLQKRFCSRGCQMSFYEWIYYPLEKMRFKRDFDWEGKKLKTIRIFDKLSGNGRKFEFSMDLWLRFLGWFVSEGHVIIRHRCYKNKIYETYYISISQTKSQEYINEIQDMIRKMGFSASFGKDRITIGSKAIFKHLIEHCYSGDYVKKKSIYNSRNKKVPSYVRFLSKEQINIFLDSFFKGDGNGGLDLEETHLCWSSSINLVGDIQELSFKCGYVATIRKCESKDCLYLVRLRKKNKCAVIRRKNIKKVLYKGKVWCVETNPYNNIFVRRKGNCHWTGNSIGYRMYVKGEVVEEGLSVIDMSRVRPHYNEERQLKNIEITKDNYIDFEHVLIVERPKNSEVLYIAADIGETAPTEISVLSKVEGQDLYQYLYDITLLSLTDKEQFKIFYYLGKLLSANFISLDCTDGTGRSIYRSLEEVFPKENLCWIGFNAKIAVDFEKNEFDQVVFKDGKPQYVEEYVSEWSIKYLVSLLYEHKIDIPSNSYKLDNQLNSILSLQSGSRIVYKCSAEENHSFQSMQVFSISEWMNRFNLIKPINQKRFFKGFI